MSTDRGSWEKKYETGETPWDTGRPDHNLTELFRDRPIPGGAALEIGCGTGTHALWLAEQGFSVTGVDISSLAVERAREAASRAGSPVRFLTADFLSEPVPGGPFDFVFDRGCFHSFDAPADRERFARAVADLLAPSGLWFSMSGSTDDPPREEGPPMRSALQLVTAMEPHFEILSLKAGIFDSRRPKAPRAWLCLLRKRHGAGRPSDSLLP